LIWLLRNGTDVVVRLLGGNPGLSGEEMREDDFRELVTGRTTLPPKQRQILAGVFDAAEVKLRDILVPRIRTLHVTQRTPAATALRQMARSRHSCAVVTAGSVDDVVGVAHFSDLVGASGEVRQYVRPALFLPISLGSMEALHRLQESRHKLAIVIDEHGGTAGIVAIEDLLEEIVGEIDREYDSDALAIERRSDGSVIVPGLFPVHDLKNLGVFLPEGRYATVAGVVLDRLGHWPQPSESFTADGWRIEVLSLGCHEVSRVRLVPAPSAAGTINVVSEPGTVGDSDPINPHAKVGNPSTSGWLEPVNPHILL
jgi:putative hemolysin